MEAKKTQFFKSYGKRFLNGMPVFGENEVLLLVKRTRSAVCADIVLEI